MKLNRQNVINTSRRLPILFALWITTFAVVYFGLLQNPTYLLNKCSSEQFLLPLNIRECFDLFGFDKDCQTVCVEVACPNRTESLENLEIIDRFNKTLAFTLLEQSNMCTRNMSEYIAENLNNITFDEIKSSLQCAHVVYDSTHDSFMFPGLCFPVADSVRVSLPTPTNPYGIYPNKSSSDLFKESHVSFVVVYFLYSVNDVSNLINFFGSIEFLAFLFTWVFLLPWLVYQLFSFLSNWVKFGFVYAKTKMFVRLMRDKQIDDAKLSTIDLISVKLEQTKRVEVNADLIKYLYTVFAGLGLLIAVCLIGFVLGQQEPTDRDNYDIGMMSDIWIWGWLIVLILAIVLLGCLFIGQRLLALGSSGYGFTMDTDYLRIYVASETPFLRIFDILCFPCCLNHYDYKLCSKIGWLALIFEILLPIVSFGINLIPTIFLINYLYFAWLVNTNWFFKLLIIYFGKITFNLAENVIETCGLLVSAVWINEIIENDQNDPKRDYFYCRYKALAWVYLCFKYIPKHLLSVLEVGFFEMSSFIVFRFGMFMPKLRVSDLSEARYKEVNDGEKKNEVEMKSSSGKIVEELKKSPKKFIKKIIADILLMSKNFYVFEKIRRAETVRTDSVHLVKLRIRNVMLKAEENAELISSYRSNSVMIILFAIRFYGLKMTIYLLAYLLLLFIVFLTTQDLKSYLIIYILKVTPLIAFTLVTIFTKLFESFFDNYRIWLLVNDLWLYKNITEEDNSIMEF